MPERYDDGGFRLAGDVGLRSFPLRIEGVEFLVQAFFGGLAGVDRATLGAATPLRSGFICH
jgi:hypothetical protein